jgi:hypothetical protein
MRADRKRRRIGWVLGLGMVLACAPDDEPADSDPTEPAEPPWPLPRTCEAPAGLGAPETIEDLVALVDALPKPTSLPCLLESLDRPIAMYATTSVAGAQPSSGPDNPRIFLLRGGLTMSLILEGEASRTLELSSAIGDHRSIKAELSFPVDRALAPSAPYDQVEFGAGTGCGLCHDAEERVESIDFATAWSSQVFQDDPDQGLSLTYVRQNAIDCDHEAEPGRCEMLDALFGHGEVVHGDLDRGAYVCHPF